MTWTLNAAGETPAAGGEPEWHKLEQELVTELRKVLSDPKFAAVSSFFRGKHLSSDVHTAVDAEPEAAPAAAAEPEAAPAPASTPAKASRAAAKTPKTESA